MEIRHTDKSPLEQREDMNKTAQAEKNAADIAYIAIMQGIDIFDDDTKEQKNDVK